MIVPALFPITTGWVVGKLDAGFAAAGQPYASGVVVLGERPAVLPARLVTVRDDSGPVSGVVSRRRQGVNVWHTDRVSCERLALLGMATLSKAADGNPVTSVSGFAGPFEINDETVPTSGGLNLSHFYFTCLITVRPTSF